MISFSSKSMNLVPKDNILQLDRLDGEWVYDLQKFLKTTSENNNLSGEHISTIIEQWEKTIVYENHTPFMIESINLEDCHGVSTYIPNPSHDKMVNDYYKTLSWFKASGYDKVFMDF